MMSVLTMRGYSFTNEDRELRHTLKFDGGDTILVGTAIAIVAVAAAVTFGLLTVPVLPAS